MRLWRRLSGEPEPLADETVAAGEESGVEAATTPGSDDAQVVDPSLDDIPPDEMSPTVEPAPPSAGFGSPVSASVESEEPVPDDPEILEPRFEAGLERSRTGFMRSLRGFLTGVTIEPATWEDVEETLIAGDVGGALAVEVVERARARWDAPTAVAAVQAELSGRLVAREPGWVPAPAVDGGPAVILVVGVNGTGKTTTIGKLAHRYRAEGQRVVLAAADTFRAAAIDQLRIWADRTGSELVAHAPGADPGAVVFDAIDAGLARRADVVIADTAGRLHTKSNLMDELAKVRRVIDRRLPGARPETLFVLDATTGQNGLAQATAFHEAVGLTGIVLTKLDSSAKGGIVFAIESTLGVPVRFVGVGERVSDLLPFEPEAFVEALFAD